MFILIKSVKSNFGEPQKFFCSFTFFVLVVIFLVYHWEHNYVIPSLLLVTSAVVKCAYQNRFYVHITRSKILLTQC